MYKIHVENIRTKSYHGCLKEEGIIGGEYRTDVWVKLKDSYRVSKVELEETVDYGIITKIYTDGRIQVAFIQKGGEIKTKTLDGSKLTLIK